MTKKTLIKWLDSKRIAAINEVATERRAAEAALQEKKCQDAKLDQLVTEIEPKLKEVYERVKAWRRANSEIVGQERGYCNTVRSRLSPLVASNQPLREVMKTYEFSTVMQDKLLRDHYEEFQQNVEKTYKDLILNVQALPDAKQGAAYLVSLGFDLSELETLEVKPTSTALMTPINTAYLFMAKKEATT